MSEQPIQMSSGIGSLELPAEDESVRVALEAALAGPDPLIAVESVVAASPRSLLAWAALGDSADRPVQRYAAYRVGYHRGLDALRANGWRGSGYVKWSAPGNRGFLRCLLGLRDMAFEIGEQDEVVRVSQFIAQLDPALGASSPEDAG